ncbi:MAG: S8 family serine peptidase, partial [Herbiconiux sp.]|nr:S8 family serine peptidase [Herbiconiux sp.]
AAGADVIVDDVTMFTDPFFQDGPIGVAISDATAEGRTYLAAAGNYTRLGVEGYPSEGAPISSWATERYRPTACPAVILEALASTTAPGATPVTSADCMDFDPAAGVDPTDTLTFEATPDTARVTFVMQWAEPVGAAVGSFRFAIVKPDGTADVVPASPAGLTSSVGATGVQEGESDFVIIRDTSAGPSSQVTPAVKVLMSADPWLQAAEYYTSTGDDTVGPTIAGHAGAPQTVSVAAAPFNDARNLETYSSGGPTVHYFDYRPDVSPVATPLATPIVTPKPDITSVDGGFTNFFGQKVGGADEVYAFFGTSAAAPAAAAVVALGREHRPQATVAEIRTALGATATSVANPLPEYFDAENITGAGLVDAAAFLEALPAPAPAPTPTPTPTAAPVPSPTPSAAPAADGGKLAATGASAAGALGIGSLALLIAGLGAVVVVRRAARASRS